MTRAALYLRISSDRSGDELGVKRQREDCLKLAEQRGWTIVAEFPENDTSASGSNDRPKFEAMIEGIKRGEFDVVIAWNLDRLTRNRRDTVRIIELGQEKHITIALARGTDLDMSSPMGRMMADQLAGWARYEIEQKSERHKRANLQRAEAGKPHKGRRAYGYMGDGLTINEDEALVLKDIANRFLNGWSYTEIANYLNDRGYKTVMGNKFYSVAVRQLLMRERYAGIRTYDGVRYEAAWTPIFDEDTWQRLQYAVKERSAMYGNKPVARRHLLTGYLECASCGATMNGTITYDRKTGEPRRTYRCNRNRTGADGQAGCGAVSRGGEPLEHFISEMIFYRLDTDALAALLNGTSRESEFSQLLAAREAKRTKLASLLDDFVDETLSKPEYKRAKARVESSIEKLDSQINDLRVSTVNLQLAPGETIRQAWAKNTDSWRRELMSLLIEKIVVKKSPKLPRYKVGNKTYYFNPDAVNVIWRN